MHRKGINDQIKKNKAILKTKSGINLKLKELAKVISVDTFKNITNI